MADLSLSTQSDGDAAQARIDLAFRRLQLAFLRAGYAFQDDTLEAAVTRAARIVEDRADREDNLQFCAEMHEHWWTDWQASPFSALREERFCFRCGSMEYQEIRT